MTTIIDRRLNPRDKTIKNREKFIARSREQIKRAVRDAINEGQIADIENGRAKVRVKGVNEPEFTVDRSTGDKKYVLPGNRDHIVGDRQDKQYDDEDGGGSEGGLGRSEDEFEFILNQDEFLDFIFEDLELPDLAKKQVKDILKVQPRRAGYTNTGNPSQLDVVRSLKNSIGRRIGLKRPKDDEMKEIEEKLKVCNEYEAKKLLVRLEELKRRRLAVPWLDPVDVRYRNFIPQPLPMTKAVMFCVMDVSGSMGKREKDLAKRFFFFLHMFLHRKYEKVDVVFIRHHEEAAEVDEDTFFHSRESGGTVVSSALELTTKIIRERYDVSEWNIYVAQASDGDNFDSDQQPLSEVVHTLLPLVQYFAYVEVPNLYYASSPRITSVRKVYETLDGAYPHLQIRLVVEKSDIWKVFKELFSKDTTRN